MVGGGFLLSFFSWFGLDWIRLDWAGAFLCILHLREGVLEIDWRGVEFSIISYVRNSRLV